MNDLGNELASGLTSLVGEPSPPSSMDVGRARLEGRAARRRRRALAGSGVASVVVAALLAVLLLPGVHRADQPVGRNPTPRPTLAGTDPLVDTLAFGWLPDGVQTKGFGHVDIQGINNIDMNIPYSAGTTLDAGGNSTKLTGGEDTITISLGVLTAAGLGDLPASVVGPPPAAPPTPTSAIAGHPAYWIIAPGTADAATTGLEELVWQYAPDDWAVLHSSFGHDTSPDVTQAIRQVAENVRFGQSIKEAMPFHLDQAPAGLAVDAQGWTDTTAKTADNGDVVRAPPPTPAMVEPRSQWAAYLVYGVGKPDPSSADMSGWSGISIAVDVANGQQPAWPAKTTSVDGNPASTLTTDASVKLSVYDVDGLNVTINASGPQAMAVINAAGGIVGYFHTLTLLGPDSANWTTAVVG